MKIITVSGPASSGKTSVLSHLIRQLSLSGATAGVVKYDSLYAKEEIEYSKYSIPVQVELSANHCPGHFFVSNLQQAVEWGRNRQFDYLFTESGAMCGRSSPYVKQIYAICVVDCLSGIDSPRKLGPVLRLADLVVITKSDLLSKAEREVFAFHVMQVNTKARVIFVNGSNGQGIQELGRTVLETNMTAFLPDYRLRFSMPSAVCSYCKGETRIGMQYEPDELNNNLMIEE